MFAISAIRRMRCAALVLSFFTVSLPAALQAQFATPAGGYIGMTLDSTLYPFGNAGVTLTIGPNQMFSNGQFIFNVSGGFIDQATTSGELGTEGGFVFGNSAHHFEFRRMTVDSNGREAYVTALVYADGFYLGRLPVLNVVADPKGVFVPLGQIVTGRIDLKLTPGVALMLDRAFGVSVKHREVVGGLYFNVVLKSDSGPQ